MSDRRRIRITREGWSFLSILGFIILGSIIQQINLLVLLSGLMIAPFFFNWRIAIKMIELVRCKRELPTWVHAGETFVVQWSVSNHRTRVPSWDLRIEERIIEQSSEARMSENAQLILPTVEPQSSGSSSYQCLLNSRGIYRFERAEVSCTFPLGLVRSKMRLHNDAELTVAPRLGTLTPAWKQLLHSSAVGMRSSRMLRGNADDEFYALRAWRSGDSRRAIHWRSSAKRGELLVRQFDQRTEREFGIVLDLWSDGNIPAATIERAASFFATVISGFRQGVRSNVTIGVFGDDFRLDVCRVNRHIIAKTMERLAVLQPDAITGIQDSLHSLQNSRSHNKPLVVISTRPMNQAIESSDEFTSLIARWINVSNDEDSQLFVPGERQADLGRLFNMTIPTD